MDFVIRLSVSTNWKDETYNSILIIVNLLIKIVHYELVKVTINALDLVKVIINTMVQYYDLLDLIIIDWDSVFISKFWFLLCYFFEITCKLSITFYLWTNGQTKSKIVS